MRSKESRVPFHTTRWSLIAATRGAPEHARPALEQLCRIYRPPVLAYVRGAGYRHGDAEDLTQGFFLHFLERGWHAQADPRRGRFRALLLTSLRRYLADLEAYHGARKRGPGPGAKITDDPDSVAGGDDPEQAFLHAWLAALVAQAMAQLEAEWSRAGKREQFGLLAPLLVDADGADLHGVAEGLGARPNTVSVQLHRMRRRLRELVRLELMQTVGSREALEQELDELRGIAGDVA